MKFARIAALIVFSAFATATVAPAQTTAPAQAPAPASSPKMMAPASSSKMTAQPAAKERTALSKDCSAQATAKGLHGKERKKFRSACKSGKAQ